jgi:hypothetical protein
VLGFLDDLEQGILYLAGNLVDMARSPSLIKQLTIIVNKLSTAITSPFKQHITRVGSRKLLETVKTAIGFGSKVAQRWTMDQGFARYLAFIDYNS